MEILICEVNNLSIENIKPIYEQHLENFICDSLVKNLFLKTIKLHLFYAYCV